MANILSVRGLSFGYQGNQVLRGVDLEIPQGSIFGYLGKNGAGKSTTIKLLLGLLPIEEGEIFFRGVSLREAPLLLRSYSSSMIEHPFFYPFLTVSENLDYLDHLFRLGIGRKNVVLFLWGIMYHANKKAQSLSSGLKQRLGLAMCLFNRPEMLILDEPLNALDPQGIYELRSILKMLNQEEGVTIFLSSHILEELEKLADHVAIIHGGKVIYQGDISGLVKKQSNIVKFKIDNTSIITQLGYDSKFSLVEIHDANHVSFEIRNENEFAQLIALMSQERIAIYNITYQESALETAFIHLTE
ncbi:ABC transporter ATP-binding protein [Porphyromonas endodontalis]|uniref:ABC transporter ATP-binding protein n=1 Tax=Porphyromonas endodontalis TaxID=28124 RepID=UPI0028E5F9FF|nr:ABC transporter ATP-binding protein [Porphyromonas endodontalis]